MKTPLFRLRELIKENKLDAALISSPSNIVYLTNYSGFSKEEREAYLFITQNKQYILTDGRYSQAAKTLMSNFKLIEISSKFSFEKTIKQLIKRHRIKHLGFEGNNLTFLEHRNFKKYFNNIYHLSISSLRAIKEKEEIINIEKACELGDKTFNYILKKIKLGVSEKELTFEIEFFIKKVGADISFRPIVAFGKNSAIPHHQASDKRLTTKDKFVLLDFGVKLNSYCSDMTRTVFFGKPTPEQKRMYETVLASQSRALDLLNSLFVIHNSIPAKNIDKAARDYIISKGYKTIPHSVGHGIGIDVHETPHLSPKSKDILKEGMVFSIEPGIYIPGLGGIRVEDIIVLEESHLRLLTKSRRDCIVL